MAQPNQPLTNHSVPPIDKRAHGVPQQDPRRHYFYDRSRGAQDLRRSVDVRTYNMAVQEATGVTPFQLVQSRMVTMMLDSMLPHEPVKDGSVQAQVISQRAKEARQPAQQRIRGQQRVDASR